MSWVCGLGRRHADKAPYSLPSPFQRVSWAACLPPSVDNLHLNISTKCQTACNKNVKSVLPIVFLAQIYRSKKGNLFGKGRAREQGHRKSWKTGTTVLQESMEGISSFQVLKGLLWLHSVLGSICTLNFLYTRLSPKVEIREMKEG